MASTTKARDGASTYEEQFPEQPDDGSARFRDPGDADGSMGRWIEVKRQAMIKYLDAQPKVTIQLPAKASTGDTAAVPVDLNHYRIVIQRGVPVEVAADVAALLYAADVW